MQICSICCDNIKNECNGFKTPCNHYMHNTCLTHWLLLKNTCPVCRHDIYEPIIDNDFEEDNEQQNIIEDIKINFLNEIYTSSYDLILNALREIIYSLTLDEEEIQNFQFKNEWIFDETNNSYILKLNTRNDIINIIVDTDLQDNILYLNIQFVTICKKISEYIRLSSKKDMLLSNYSSVNFPTRINCY